MPGDYVSDYTVKFGSFEAEEVALARHTCHVVLGEQRMAHSAFADIGCHIGNYSVELGSDFGTILAVDAVASYVHVARANLAWNGLDLKSHVLHCAVSDHDGKVPVRFERTGNLGNARITDAAAATEAGSEVLQVDALMLDSLLERTGIADLAFVKIDVEGHEEAVLCGAAKIISSAKPLIQVEVDQGHLPSVTGLLREMHADYEAWQVARGDPRLRHVFQRLWMAIKRGGNPLFMCRLDPEVPNTRHLPCVLFIPKKIDPKLLQVGA